MVKEVRPEILLFGGRVQAMEFGRRPTLLTGDRWEKVTLESPLEDYPCRE